MKDTRQRLKRNVRLLILSSLLVLDIFISLIPTLDSTFIWALEILKIPIISLMFDQIFKIKSLAKWFGLLGVVLAVCIILILIGLDGQSTYRWVAEQLLAPAAVVYILKTAESMIEIQD